MTDVTEWLDKQLQAANLTEAELCRKGGIDSGTLSNAKSRNRVGLELAKKIAKGLGRKQSFVFYQLGLIDDDPDNPEAQLDPIEAEILDVVSNKPDAAKRAALATLQALFESLDAGTSGRNNSRNREATSRQNKG